MEFAKYKIQIPFFVFVTIFAIISTTQANTIENIGNNTVKHHEHDEWFQRKLAEAYNASLKAYHDDPTEVVDELNRHVHQ